MSGYDIKVSNLCFADDTDMTADAN